MNSEEKWNRAVASTGSVETTENLVRKIIIEQNDQELEVLSAKVIEIIRHIIFDIRREHSLLISTIDLFELMKSEKEYDDNSINSFEDGSDLSDYEETIASIENLPYDEELGY